jgi:hypothetical protein
VNGDELTFYENDSLEIIGTGDCDGWLKVNMSISDFAVLHELHMQRDFGNHM